MEASLEYDNSNRLTGTQYNEPTPWVAYTYYPSWQAASLRGRLSSVSSNTVYNYTA